MTLIALPQHSTLICLLGSPFLSNRCFPCSTLVSRPAAKALPNPYFPEFPHSLLSTITIAQHIQSSESFRQLRMWAEDPPPVAAPSNERTKREPKPSGTTEFTDPGIRKFGIPSVVVTALPLNEHLTHPSWAINYGWPLPT